jgi:hypothetical protein
LGFDLARAVVAIHGDRLRVPGGGQNSLLKNSESGAAREGHDFLVVP